MTRAVVLGGGGVTGIAWEAGVARGLWAHGIDLTAADTFVGTSAGSVVATQLAAGVAPEELFRAQFRPASYESSPMVDVDGLLEALARASRGATDARDARARVGSVARSASVGDPEARRSVIATRLAGLSWPTGLRVTAVDADSGEVVVFDHTSGIDLVDAVAASCAVPGVYPTVTIGGRHYMDGGAASVAHADLAGDHAAVVVVAPISPEATAATTALDDEVAALTAAGGHVVVVGPDLAYQHDAGAEPLNPGRRGDAARAGEAFAARAARRVRDVWADQTTSYAAR
ncbi:patatin-like phospholipase family protein [Actinomycetospora endophytica]|uniref:Patatin-like phospholipase family protein n=1 Tax=Actinomycetospora endophytica TaxID=2291215 RepID=A0ABS8PDH9_9PSEU|nr:patatin-like phospholipase family protein [Actinomycetospora endophytica]MCD2196335.1 patatin-like phospholipase family protein [Actinomycetospora endophytica]